ncbi:MAG: type II toxin-antitoxin system VapC family toxin [Ignavibacterium album]|uniref:type II toxin-antitoxin system VapC family toxin n=1 Tax=Ignavibacterium album TaxID=591197 RepID=UPI0026EC5452|nr:type II toxin-antitoxin system VapC family toxin [Ignavibacterium album]MBI5660557.1 type II toxin-antitoxin system VapC family toxin [Ignavibacterium album]
MDSNIIIYSGLEKFSFLRELFYEENVFISDITILEVLGFSRITPEQEEYFEDVFSIINRISISNEIITEAIRLRKNFNLSVGDAIIAATAKVHNLTLYTNNESDFSGITFLNIVNPLSYKQ